MWSRLETAYISRIKDLREHFATYTLNHGLLKEEIDREILEILRGAGEYGILPRDISHQLEIRKLTPWKATQRIRRINKRLDRIIGQKAAEKHAMQWALTSFMREAWGSAKEDLLEKAEDRMKS